VEREEALKRRMVLKERERDIAKKLGEIGGGAGKEYMSRAAVRESSAVMGGSGGGGLSTTSTLPGEKPPRPDARALGLVAPRGEQPRVDLGRAKRKRPDSAASSSTVQEGLKGRAAFGWGTDLSKKLGRMKEGEKLDGSSAQGRDIEKMFKDGRERSPVRKKTRFVTEKGIREAGRESIGEPLSAAVRGRQVVLDDDDDDDLIIVK
jgi:minichromosome maintenance protein 10